MDTTPVNTASRRSRRRHSAAFKASIIAACHQPGVSVAAIALANGLNANMLRKWVKESQRSTDSFGPAAITADQPPPASLEFVALPNVPRPSEAPIQISIERSGTTISIAWPQSSAGQCAAWLNEVLR